MSDKTVDYWTIPYVEYKLSHCHKHHAIYSISIAGAMAPPTRYSISHMVFCRIIGSYTKKSTAKAKMTPTDVTLMLLGCIVCILIIIDMLFAERGAE